MATALAKPFGRVFRVGRIKSHCEDFIVDELALDTPCGEGEHLWLKVSKTNTNTLWVVKTLAAALGVRENDIGYAGLKDRRP